MLRMIILGVLTIAGAIPSPAHNHRFATIPGKYIVKFKADIMISSSIQLKNSLAHRPDHEYSMGDFHGFSGALSRGEIEYIEGDSYISTASIVRQNDAPWGLARISQRQFGDKTYIYDSSAGEGTCDYIIDTGIDTEHPEFEDRATSLVDLSGEDSLTDGEGHGTHCAGTVGSKTYGVAKKAKLLAIKVLNSSGSRTTSGAIAGFNYAVNHAKNNTSKCPLGFAANISLGGPKSQAINAAMKAMVEAGIFTAVAARNYFDDASEYSPSSEESACIVGAMAVNDTMPSFRILGKLLVRETLLHPAYFSADPLRTDILAPGVGITSTWPNNGTKDLMGTSMAAPHIAGLGAYLLGLGQVDKNEICEYIQSLATKNILQGVPTDTVNLVAYNGASG